MTDREPTEKPESGPKKVVTWKVVAKFGENRSAASLLLVHLTAVESVQSVELKNDTIYVCPDTRRDCEGCDE